MISSYTRRRSINLIGTGLAVAAVLLAVIPLGAMLAYVMEQGGSSIDLDFFTQLPKPVGETGGGMANAIMGTLMLISIASVIGLPIGIMSGIYLAQAGRRLFPRMARFVTDVIAGTP